MKVYSQLISAQLENRTSSHTAAPIGRMWFRTDTTKFVVSDGTNIRSMLRNDQFCVFGNSGTASQNTRLNRSAANALQLVTGDDTTAEGSTSTSCAQIDARAVNYSTAGLPAAAAGNAGRIAFNTTTGALNYDNGGTWTAVASGATTNRVNAMYDYYVGSAAQVTSGAATHSSIASAISAASAGNSIYLLEGTYTENITVSKRLFITGSGYGSYINGTVTFDSSSDQSFLGSVRVSDTITLQAGADGVICKNIWLLSTKSFAVESTVVGEIVEASLY